MGDKRKLQGEIERCLKKVAEGVETFEDIWKKVYNANNANQKEKYEMDLKKEIKKLQRLRDQLKSWLSANDIKDKKSIQEARKRIEQQMERFKIVERETKTKAYSKEGLGAAQKLDPAQKEKEETIVWLTACINRLNIQLDKFEMEIETCNLCLKKKKNDKEKADRLEELKVRHGKHKYHINQLEALLRMLDNGTVEVEQIKKIKDDVEYYIDCAEDPDFHENEFMYDDLNLEDLEDYLAKQQSSYQQAQLDLKLSSADDEGSLVASTPTSASSSSPSHSPSLGNHSSESSTPLPKIANVPETNLSRGTTKEETSCNVENSVPTEGNVSTLSIADMLNCQTVINSQSSTSYTVTSPATSNKHFKMSSNHESIWSSTTSSNEELSNSVNTKSFQTQNSRSETSVLSSVSSSKPSVNNSAWTDSKYSSSIEPSKREDSSDKSCVSKTDSQLYPTSDNKNVTVNSQEPTKIPQSSIPVSMSSNPGVSDSTGTTLRNLAEQSVIGSGISNHIRSFFPAPSNKDLPTTHNVSRNNSSDLFSEASCNNTSEREIYINLAAVFGEIPPHSSPTNEEYLAILERAKDNLPLPIDSQKQRHPSIGSCPMTVPDYYNIYISSCNTKEFFQRLSTETLFFIFYFLQGTKAQYFAARALKIKSWRFHTMFMMWFQRHEEPQKITDEYEQGTYIYFDYERWAQRKKEGFTFEYKYLEDKDFN